MEMLDGMGRDDTQRSTDWHCVGVLVTYCYFWCRLVGQRRICSRVGACVRTRGLCRDASPAQENIVQCAAAESVRFSGTTTWTSRARVQKKKKDALYIVWARVQSLIPPLYRIICALRIISLILSTLSGAYFFHLGGGLPPPVALYCIVLSVMRQSQVNESLFSPKFCMCLRPLLAIAYFCTPPPISVRPRPSAQPRSSSTHP
ncbi:hypothetical protein EDB87DRAFT_785039 [Lactarius vividus]|nr:hypothetical protein EDB87DRAFT_785039 [Lactarius vividus]